MNEKLLIFSDLHVPQQDRTAVQLLLNGIKSYHPDILVNNGDFLNFERLSRFDQIEEFEQTLGDEINEGYELLKEIREATGDKCQIFYVEGNHELRMTKWMYKNARVLNQIRSGDYSLISVPNLLHLAELNVQWVPFMSYIGYKGLVIEHGHNPRKGAGNTGRARLISRMRCGFSGDCHRLAHINARIGEKEMWWIETGCLQKYEVGYIHKGEADWQHGFAIAEFDGQNWHPQIVPIINNSFMMEGKMHDA